MRRLKVRHERLPKVGELFEIVSEAGIAVTVVSQSSGRRTLSIGPVDAEQPDATALLTRLEANALAALLTGAHIELVPRPREQRPTIEVISG